MKFRHIFLAAGLAVATTSMAADNVTVLYYQVSEPGLETYPARVLVSPEYIRFDDGIDSGDFALYDRKQQHIYSVTHEDELIFSIPQRDVTLEPPEAIVRQVDDVPLTGESPTINGLEPVSKVLRVNDQPCYNIVSVPGLLTDTVTALAEFRSVLAGEHARVLPGIPADMRDSCDMALHTFAPTWQLEFGMPIQEWDERGKIQALVNFRTDMSVDDALFRLPERYQQYTSDAAM